MSPRTHVPGSPAGLSLAEGLVADKATVVDLALLERVYLDLVALEDLEDIRDLQQP